MHISSSIYIKSNNSLQSTNTKWMSKWYYLQPHRRKNNHRWKFKREWSCSVPVNRTVQYFSFPGNNGERSRPCNQQRAMGRHINGNNSQQLRDCQVVRQFTRVWPQVWQCSWYMASDSMMENAFIIIFRYWCRTSQQQGQLCIEFPLLIYRSFIVSPSKEMFYERSIFYYEEIMEIYFISS